MPARRKVLTSAADSRSRFGSRRSRIDSGREPDLPASCLRSDATLRRSAPSSVFAVPSTCTPVATSRRTTARYVRGPGSTRTCQISRRTTRIRCRPPQRPEAPRPRDSSACRGHSSGFCTENSRQWRSCRIAGFRIDSDSTCIPGPKCCSSTTTRQRGNAAPHVRLGVAPRTRSPIGLAQSTTSDRSPDCRIARSDRPAELPTNCTPGVRTTTPRREAWKSGRADTRPPSLRFAHGTNAIARQHDLVCWGSFGGCALRSPVELNLCPRFYAGINYSARSF